MLRLGNNAQLQTLRRTYPSEPRFNSRSLCNVRPSSLFKILFLGRDEFSCIVLERLYAARDVWEHIQVTTYPDGKKRGRHGQPGIAPLKHVAERLKLPLSFIPPTKPQFKSWEPPEPFGIRPDPTPDPAHVILTASFGRLIHDPVLHSFLPCRRINVHPSLLPAFRGPAPIQHTIFHGGSVVRELESTPPGDGRAGVCILEMKEKRYGADVGVIWGRKEIPLEPTAKYATLRDHLGGLGGDLLVKVLREMLAGTALSTPQDAAIPTSHAGLITLKMAEVDFETMDAHRLVRLDQAISHQRSLVVHTPNRRSVQLFTPSVYSPHESHHPTLQKLLEIISVPGDTWFCPETNSVLVRCVSNTVLSVPELQLQGKARVSARDWWQGVKGLGHVRRVDSTLVSRLGSVPL